MAASRIHPNDAARLVLKELHSLAERLGQRKGWANVRSDDEELFGPTGLAVDNIDRALQRLEDRGLVRLSADRRVLEITDRGMRAQEEPRIADELLPLPTTTLRGDEGPHAPPLEMQVHVLDLLPSLGFVGDHEPGLREIIEHDLGELERTLADGLPKAAILLSGSILEAVLIDVLDRRRDLASPYLKKKRFPDDASLDDLLQIAAGADLIGDGRRLLGPSALAMGSALKEHRDLIHPHAQLRKHIVIDGDTARAMASLLRLVVRDLRAAWEDGTISAYEKK